MWPWAHVAAAYLLYAGLRRHRGRPIPGDLPTIALVLGAVGPDLVDKPLAWYLAILPHGRTLAHSLLFGGVVVGVAVVLARRRGHGWIVGPFALGYVVHIAGDAYQPLLTRSFDDLFFLAWPVASAPPAESISLLTRLQSVDPTLFLAFEIVVTVAGLALWLGQGRPGLSTLLRWATPWRETAS